MRERFRHETVGNIFPMVRIFPASAHGGHHPDPSPNLTRSPNPKPNPNPNQRPTCLVCQLVVVLGKALFGVRALEKFAIHGRFFTAAPHLGYNDRMRSRGASHTCTSTTYGDVSVATTSGTPRYLIRVVRICLSYHIGYWDALHPS